MPASPLRELAAANGGRRSVMTPDKLRVARELRDGGQHTMAAIARTIGVGRATLYRHLVDGTS